MDTDNNNGTPVEQPGASKRRGKGMLLAWGVLLVGAIAAVSGYFIVDARGGDDSDDQAAANQGTGVASEQEGIVNALEEEGLLPVDADSEDVAGALIRGASGAVGGKHDNGESATFTQVSTLSDEALVSLFPSEYVRPEDIPALKAEIMAAREFAQTVQTVEAAQAAGFYQATNDVPFMGEHWISRAYLTDGVFDASKPEGLLFSTIDGERKLVGVWFLQIPGIGDVKPDVEPVGFTSSFDLWHAHIGLCIVKLQGASEGETREGCEAKGGSFTADLRWMMHVWVAPEAVENSRGVFGYLNGDLYKKQQATKDAAGSSADPAGVVSE
jgi:hypothetical protein